MKKLLILGLDGLDRYFLEENADELPHFQEMMRNSRTSLLESTLPPITIPAWASSFTGLRPERFDRFDFQVVDFDAYEFQPEPLVDCLYREFWNYMEGDVAVSDIPGMELREIDGWMVGGLLNVADNPTYPPELEEEIREDIGDFEIEGLEHCDTEAETRQEMFKIFDKRKKVFDWLLENKEAEAYFMVFRLPDNMMHHCENEEQMVEAYRRCDEYLGELMERKVNIIALSDHGAVEADTRFSVNTWLREEGYLKQLQGGEEPLWKKKVYQIAEKLEARGFRDILVWANNKYAEITGEPFTERNLELETIDWDETEAFSYMTGVCSYSGIWINDDRFSNPSVEHKEEKKDEIKRELEKHELVEEVLKKENVFLEEAESFPDLVAVLKQNVKNDSDIKPSVSGRISSYMHRKQGFIGTHGDVFEGSDENAELIDLAPTVLHYFGEPIPDEMDGKVLDIFADDSEPGRREPERVSEDVGGLDV